METIIPSDPFRFSTKLANNIYFTQKYDNVDYNVMVSGYFLLKYSLSTIHNSHDDGN